MKRQAGLRRGVAQGVASALLLLGASSCSGSEPEPLTGVEAGEQFPGGATTNGLLLGEAAFTRPATNIDDDNRSLFFSGNSFFNQSWVQAPSSTTARDGLGPLFNSRSCSGCHFKDGRGAPPLDEAEPFSGLLLRLSMPGAGPYGEPLPEPSYGGQLQHLAVADVSPEGTPRVSYTPIEGSYADGEPYQLLKPSYSIETLRGPPLAERALLSPRVAPAMIGLGLLQAVPSWRLESLADPGDADEDGVTGRLNLVWDFARERESIGRFGWKAEQPSVRQQTAGALLGDMGLTSGVFPEPDCTESEPDCLQAPSGGSPEVSDDVLTQLEAYGLLLAVPVRTEHDEPDVLQGKSLFNTAGCAKCHVPSHQTEALSGFPELEDQRIFPYTDLLLHDMGPELGDGRPVFAAEGDEWRTPPLWGLRFYPTVNGHDRLLHDGRARGVAEAILWHGGEGEAAKRAFLEMNRDERMLLVRFVESL
jgi:CxxC motif-containing protein (DUF1111 family)